jgi:hypothetical protein
VTALFCQHLHHTVADLHEQLAPAPTLQATLSIKLNINRGSHSRHLFSSGGTGARQLCRAGHSGASEQQQQVLRACPALPEENQRMFQLMIGRDRRCDRNPQSIH